MIRTEYFAKGTEPTDKCDCHTAVTICTESELPASEFCPKDKVKERIYITRPKGSHGTTADSKYELPKNFSEKTCNVHTSYQSTIESSTSKPDKNNKQPKNSTEILLP